MRFENKVILVVGGSSGIGSAVALKLAAAGAIVAVTARRADRLAQVEAAIRGRGGECMTLPANAEDPKAAEGVVAAVVARHGRLDAILLNAGGAPALDMRQMTATDVLSYMRSNYDVMVNYLFPALAQMRRQGHGLVAQTNSLAGFIGTPLQGPYSAAKAAGRLLIDTCRLEFARDNIRFVSIYPGFVSTEATQGDGMPAPMEISEDAAAAHVIKALRQERWDYAFPFPMSGLVALLRAMPKAWSAAILRGELKNAAP
jgi:NAD(P)-dependent dehydrogenase (short-subunit alcohol dehydrogenase family)